MTDHQVTILAAAVTAGFPTLAVLVGILINNRMIDSLRRELDVRFAAIDQRFAAMDQRFNDLEKLFTEKLLRVEEVLDARLKHLEER